MDENDLGTRMQRSSDRLRSGEFSDPAETALTSDLQKLGQQVGDAARALGSAQHTSKDAALNRAMDDLSRLRDQLAGLGGRSKARQAGRSIPCRSAIQQGSATVGNPASSASRATGQRAGTGRQGGQGQARAAGWSRRQAGADKAGGPVRSATASPVRSAIRPVARQSRSQRYGAYDTGNTRISGQAVAPQQGPNPADTQRQIDQGLNLLNQVRAVVQDSPEARQQLQSLIDQMRNLDPSRFPGNPALVEQMHQQLVSNVDALELQLRRQLDENQGGTIRNTDPAKVPAGYQDSVAEYYRKLSGGGHLPPRLLLRRGQLQRRNHDYAFPAGSWVPHDCFAEPLSLTSGVTSTVIVVGAPFGYGPRLQLKRCHSLF
jgi:hypothetical protein